ncbi:MAG: 2-hydroxychromene-2-carboxylate isomerase [Devosiaceae bacterium]|nr:2-hydroxychromene-2-carboxylate isomerase [Devosiaceae bacterium MH13]
MPTDPLPTSSAPFPSIDYFFTLISPFSYLGHKAFLAVAGKHGAAVRYRPFNLFDVFKTSGAVPVPQRPASRQAYRLIELQRIAHFRDLPLTLKPKHWPTNPALADGAVQAIADGGGDPSDYMFRAFQACWVEDRDIADEATVAELLTAAGHDAAAVIAIAQSEAVVAERASNTEAAIAAGAVGAPVYTLAGEPFWGQDRIEYLDHALASGRGAFSPS